MKTYAKKLISGSKWAAVPATFISGAAMAVDHSAAITSAQTDATANVTAAVVAVIGISAICFGLYAVVRMIGK